MSGRPSGSVELDVSVIVWPVKGSVGDAAKAATGAAFALTVTVFEAVCQAPSSSMTTRRTV